ncbi:MAG: radical SAM protein [Proteobacteria bacterium]|nr:radical SAM protein [Pseudomonadota bacterium]
MIRKIALISPLDCFDNYGLRSISAYLKSMGIETTMIFLPRYAQIWHIVFHQNKPGLYSRALLDEIRDCVMDNDAIGITMMSSDRDRVKALTQHLRPTGKPIILGGVHPSSFPGDALELADCVIVGEGYEPLYEWCLDPDNPDILNLWKRLPDGAIKQNDIRPAMDDIDRLPFPDYGLQHHFIAEKGHLVPLNDRLLRKYMGRYYSVFTSHGCPFECSYCINSRYKQLGKGYDCFRYHSVDYVIAELKYCLSLSPDLEYVSIPDDGFIFHDEAYIEEFAEKYKEEINLPFAVMGIIPSYLTRKKLDCLVRAGMIRTRTGFQSANKRTLKSYRRPGLVSKFTECHDMLRSYPDLVFPYYDLIIDNPLVDTEKDMEDSIEFLLKLEGRFTLILYSLRMYCGTELYEQARKMDLDPWYYHSHYGNYSKKILTLVIMIIQATNSKPLARFVMNIYRRRGNIACPDIFFKLFMTIWLVRQGIEHMKKGDRSTIPTFFARLFVPSKRKHYPGWKTRHDGKN